MACVVAALKATRADLDPQNNCPGMRALPKASSRLAQAAAAALLCSALLAVPSVLPRLLSGVELQESSDAPSGCTRSRIAPPHATQAASGTSLHKLKLLPLTKGHAACCPAVETTPECSDTAPAIELPQVRRQTQGAVKGALTLQSCCSRVSRTLRTGSLLHVGRSLPSAAARTPRGGIAGAATPGPREPHSQCPCTAPAARAACPAASAAASTQLQ